MRCPGEGERKLNNWNGRWVPEWVVFEGKVWLMRDWTKATGITAKLIGFRLHWLGWEPEAALTVDPVTNERTTVKNP